MSMLDKIGNPVGFKIMRAMLVIPEQYRNIATANGLKNVYLFIGELLGYKNGTVQGKIEFGREAYFNRTLIEDIELDDLYENIWLERLYEDIDRVLNVRGNYQKVLTLRKYELGTMTLEECAKVIETFEYRKWSVPIEIDVSASVLAIIGLLLGHKPFMKRTNMIGNTIQDAWKHDVVTNRVQFKSIMRIIYGSSMPTSQMWLEDDIQYTTEELQAFSQELKDGELAVAAKFRDFLIKNANMKEEMNIVVDKEEFTIYCNKFRNVGEKTTKYDVYNSATNSIRTIQNTSTKKVPDLKRFAVSTVTTLIHNLDSQCMNNTVEAVIDKFGWVIDIHDAIIVCPEVVDYARDIYCSGTDSDKPSLERIYRERNSILSKYFTSIGIRPSKIKEWGEVMSKVDKFEGEFRCNRIVLK